MQLAKNATVAVAVADGQKFNLFRNAGDEAGLNLTPCPMMRSTTVTRAPPPGRHGSSANPDGGQDEEDGFSAGVIDLLNKKVLAGQARPC